VAVAAAEAAPDGAERVVVAVEMPAAVAAAAAIAARAEAPEQRRNPAQFINRRGSAS
jgi:hypothetical protein